MATPVAGRDAAERRIFGEQDLRELDGGLRQRAEAVRAVAGPDDLPITGEHNRSLSEEIRGFALYDICMADRSRAADFSDRSF